VPRFLRYNEVSITSDAEVNDEGIITMLGENPTFSIGADTGAMKFNVKGVRIHCPDAPAIPSPDGIILAIARAHQGVIYKVLGLVYLNVDANTLTLTAENDFSHRRVLHLPFAPGAPGRQIFVDFSDDDDPVDRDNTIEVFTVSPNGDAGRCELRVVVEDL